MTDSFNLKSRDDGDNNISDRVFGKMLLQYYYSYYYKLFPQSEIFKINGVRHYCRGYFLTNPLLNAIDYF